MISPFFYWLIAVACSAGAVIFSLLVYHWGEEMAARPFFSLLAGTAVIVAVAFFLPFTVFPFKLLVWVLCSWLGLAGLVAMGRALYSGDDIPLALVGFLWFAEALLIGIRGAVSVRILVHGAIPWFIAGGLLLFILLIVRSVFTHLDIRSHVLPEEGIVVLGVGVAVLTLAGCFLPTAVEVYKIATGVILLWLIVFGLILAFQDNREEKRTLGLMMLGAACCVAQVNPLFSLGIIAQVLCWALTVFLALILLYLTGHYWEHNDLFEEWPSSVLFGFLPLAIMVILGVFLPGTVPAFKFLIPVLCCGLLLNGLVFFFRGIFSVIGLEILTGLCFLQGAFVIALCRKYILFFSSRLGWPEGAGASWLAFNGVFAAALVLSILGRRGFRLVSRLKERGTQRRIAQLTEAAARLDDGRHHDLVDLSRQHFVRVSARGVDITAIDIRVENQTRRALKIRLAAGTCFVGNGLYQNMTARSEMMFTLQELSLYSCRIPAVCVNAGKPIPNDKNAFFSVSPSPADLTRFLQSSAEEDPMVAQAGVWALTDKYTSRQVQSRLMRGGSPAVSDQHIRKAKDILDELGIPHSF